MKKGFSGIMDMANEAHNDIINNKHPSISIPNEYIVYDRMPREAPTEASLETLSDFIIYDNPRSTKVVGTVSRGEIVKRTSCIAYTYPKKNPVRITRAIKCYKKNNSSNSPEGPLLEIGSYVYLLMYTGEGTYLGWYKGEEVWWLQGCEINNVYSKTASNSWGNYEGDSLSQNLFVEVWYKIVKNDGTTGWTLVAQNGDFSNEPVKPYYGHRTVSTNTNTNTNVINNNEINSSNGKLIIFASLLILLIMIGLNNTNNYNTPTNSNNTTKTVTNSSTQNSTPKNTSKSNKPKAPIEPIAKQNIITGYDNTKPLLNNNGLCELTVDNTKNNMPVYVRIWNVTDNVPVRAFYISQGDEFTANNLDPGWYQVRYIELYDNDVPATGAKSESFELEQINTYNGIQYSQMTLTLYKVKNGNTYTSSIPADEI